MNAFWCQSGENGIGLNRVLVELARLRPGLIEIDDDEMDARFVAAVHRRMHQPRIHVIHVTIGRHVIEDAALALTFDHVAPGVGRDREVQPRGIVAVKRQAAFRRHAHQPRAAVPARQRLQQRLDRRAPERRRDLGKIRLALAFGQPA